MRAPPYFKAWVIFFLIAGVGGMVVGFAIGAILGAVLTMAGVGIVMIKIAAGAMGFLFGLPISYYAFRWVVSEFIVKAVAPEPPLVDSAPSQASAPQTPEPPLE